MGEAHLLRHPAHRARVLGHSVYVAGENGGQARDSLIWRINSLMARFKSLLGRNKFPVQMRRESRRKPLNLALNFEPIAARSRLGSAPFPRSSRDNIAHVVLRLTGADDEPPMPLTPEEQAGWDAVGYASVSLGISRSVPDDFRKLAEKDL